MDSEGASQFQRDVDDSSEGVNGDDRLDELRRRVYQPKDDIIEAIQDYHAHTMRNFRVAASDKRRYKVVCMESTCNFVAQFAFQVVVRTSAKAIPHSCQPDLPIEGRRRFCTDRFLVRHTDLREFFLAYSQSVFPIMFKRKPEALGMCPTYQNCVNACNKLKDEVFGNDYTQYRSLPSCIDELTKNGHKAIREMDDGVFL